MKSKRIEVAVLRACLRNWERASVKVGRQLVYQRRYFADPLIREAVSELVLAGGDWRSARECLRGRSERADRLVAWGNKVAGVL